MSFLQNHFHAKVIPISNRRVCQDGLAIQRWRGFVALPHYVFQRQRVRRGRHAFRVDLAQSLEVIEDFRELLAEVVDVFFAQPNARQTRDMLHLLSRKGQP